jgi:hypothetical protein
MVRYIRNKKKKITEELAILPAHAKVNIIEEKKDCVRDSYNMCRVGQVPKILE